MVLTPALFTTTTLDPPLAKLILLPETVIALPPAWRVWDPAIKNAGLALAAEAAEAKNDVAASVAPLTTTDEPPAASESVVPPATVMAEPPAARVWEPMIIDGSAGAIDCVFPFTTTAEAPGARDRVVAGAPPEPETVMAAPPGVRV